MPVGSVAEKFKLYLASTFLLEELFAEYLRETNISLYLSLMFICTLAALKKSSKKKKTETKNEIVEVSKEGREVKILDDKILDFDLKIAS